MRGGQILAKNGRYGPYVSNEGINATLPRDKTPDTVTLDEAIALIDARAEAVGSAPPKRRAVKKPTARKTHASKQAAANAREPTKTAGKITTGKAKAAQAQKSAAEAKRSEAAAVTTKVAPAAHGQAKPKRRPAPPEENQTKPPQ